MGVTQLAADEMRPVVVGLSCKRAQLVVALLCIHGRQRRNFRGVESGPLPTFQTKVMPLMVVSLSYAVGSGGVQRYGDRLCL